MLRSDDSAFLSGSPFDRLAWLAVPLLAGALALGCTPKIGDECSVSTNCSATGDRLCDTTQPGGYCTLFNCEPGTCPADSVCINFGTTLAAGPGCTPSQGNSPYQRSFCMANCSGTSDCRPGYECLDLSGSEASKTSFPTLGAVLADSSGNGKVCAVNPYRFTGGSAGGPTGSDDVGVCVGDNGGARSVAQGGSGGASGGGGASGEAGDTSAGSGASGDGGVGG